MFEPHDAYNIVVKKERKKERKGLECSGKRKNMFGGSKIVKRETSNIPEFFIIFL